MKRLAFLTLEDRGDFVIDDVLAIEELRHRGYSVDEVPWRRLDANEARRRFDAVLVRTPWDYQHDLEAFLTLLERLEGAGVRLANTASIVRWNAVKTYLGDLADRGVVVVPTVYGESIDEAMLRALPERLASTQWVLKPVVGANASDAYRLDETLSEDPPLSREIAERYEGRMWLAQPFVESVLYEGEYSLFYFDGVLSHAIRKVPRLGDFRVQEEHGGTISRIEPTAELREAAQRVMGAIAFETPLQARVDLLRLGDGRLALMELEAIEPSLYFRMHPAAPANFADAVERWLARGHAPESHPTNR